MLRLAASIRTDTASAMLRKLAKFPY